MYTYRSSDFVVGAEFAVGNLKEVKLETNFFAEHVQ